MRHRSLLFCCLLAFAMTAHAGHFITDASYRQKVNTAFNHKMHLVGTKFFQVRNLGATQEEQEALEFLYAYMPIADVTDYPTRYHLNNVRVALRARREMPWGGRVPEMLFRHFVLPMRVNNEPLDSSRVVFYRTLKDRVKGMTMEQAILEVNHWCHEHVTYEPSDARTSSPLQTLRTGRGRCGEESTFTVAALRSIGIPARQVYTPRWAHTDDNHAWVEAWADGKWHFLGACEPEPVLDLGWFNIPASRALLTHTRVFGDYEGPEEVMLRTPNNTEINLIDNYGSSAPVRFHVVFADGSPAADARVDFKIYNYAEFYPAVAKYTDRDGYTTLSAGKGDMLVWASKNGYYGYVKASFGKDSLLTIRLTNNGSTVFSGQELDIVPPPEQAHLPVVSAEARAKNDRRFSYEDSLRNAYIASFPTIESLKQYPDTAAVPLLVKARGNWKVIEAFLLKYKGQHDRAIRLLESLSDKDLRDIPMEILDDNMLASTDQLCPRVEDEMITRPFKCFFERVFASQAKSFRANPSRLAAWMSTHIRLNPDKKSMSIAQTPIGVYESGLTDERGRDIFFVDVARSLGIEARKDVVTSKVQYMRNGQWVDVNFDHQKSSVAQQGTLVLDYQPTEQLENPKYYSYFTISKIVSGRTSLLNFDEEQVDMGGGTSWANTFKNGTPLDAGTYLLVTGQRLADGSVLARNTIFRVMPGKTTHVALVIRESTDGVKVIGNFDSESLYQSQNKGMVSILSQTGRGYFVVGLLGIGQEPTNHALHDLARVKAQLDRWGRPLVFLFENEEAAKKFVVQANEFGALPSNTLYGIDKDGKIRKQIVAGMHLKSTTQLPVFIIADTFNRVLFVSQGYTIGLGEQISKVAAKL
ncbi:transglutaminase family protein [Hallella multisaccharivorax]|uniref:transglutaminase-like domain-containing protein n=1 Tax=Hallella multisaccharivorax TaxID=310514 RepID=UPI0036145172